MMKTNKIMQQLQNRNISIMGKEMYNHFSVLLPLITIEQDVHVLFEVRSANLRSQPGDICFPGGRMDPEDSSELACAIRETSEELGIAERLISDVTPLDYIVSDHGFIIYPFVGTLPALPNLNINKAEVAEVFTVPLSYFLEIEPKKYKMGFQVEPEADFPYELIQGGKDYKWRLRKRDELFYIYEGKTIWGITARIIHHFVQIIKDQNKE